MIWRRKFERYAVNRGRADGQASVWAPDWGEEKCPRGSGWRIVYLWVQNHRVGGGEGRAFHSVKWPTCLFLNKTYLPNSCRQALLLSKTFASEAALEPDPSLSTRRPSGWPRRREEHGARRPPPSANAKRPLALSIPNAAGSPGATEVARPSPGGGVVLRPTGGFWTRAHRLVPHNSLQLRRLKNTHPLHVGHLAWGLDDKVTGVAARGLAQVVLAQPGFVFLAAGNSRSFHVTLIFDVELLRLFGGGAAGQAQVHVDIVPLLLGGESRHVRERSVFVLDPSPNTFWWLCMDLTQRTFVFGFNLEFSSQRPRLLFLH